MLPRDHRITEPADFRTTVRSGRRSGGSVLVVHLASSASADVPRVGFVTSKALGSAVVRNRVKRRLRAISRPIVAELPVGSALVVRALPASTGCTYAELETEFRRCLDRVML